MKTASPALQAHFGLDCTTLAALWCVVRQDGLVMGFTTHDQDISYQSFGPLPDPLPVLYAASTGISNTASDSSSDLSVDNSEVTGFLDSSAISEGDIRAGVYDNCFIIQRVVNWADLTMADMIQGAGFLGTVHMKNGLFTAEFRGLTQRLTTSMGSTYGPCCRAELFSNEAEDDGSWRPWYCNLKAADYVQSGSVVSSPDAMTLIPASGLLEIGSSPYAPAAAGWFSNGVLTFTSGVLKGKSFEVKGWDGSALDMFLPFPVAPEVGDTFDIWPGCDHTPSATGCIKFNNIINFRGEPFIPGIDTVLSTAGASA